MAMSLAAESASIVAPARTVSTIAAAHLAGQVGAPAESGRSLGGVSCSKENVRRTAKDPRASGSHGYLDAEGGMP
jgi:hypothetical protein